MDIRPPLHIHLLAHPKSVDAKELVSKLTNRFVEPPACGGLRVPIFFTPDRGDDLPPTLSSKEGLNLEAAKHTLVVILADARMLRTVQTGTGQAWQNFVSEVRKSTPLDSSPHHLLPVALDEEGFLINAQGHVLPALLNHQLGFEAATERRLAEISFHVAARAIQLLENGMISAVAQDRIKAPVRIFLSHAKADLDPARQDPVRFTAAACDDEAFPIEKWFDSRNIATSQDFAEAIVAGIRDCSIMLAFLTDQYSSRQWCRREVLEAKRMGAHILIVNALESGESRSFPYGGNVPVIRWNYGSPPEVEARRVIDRAVLEALRFQHNRAVLANLAEADDHILSAPPEALILAAEPEGELPKTYLYPDPPLGREELEVLHRLRPKVHFITPLTRLAARSKPKAVETICVGISESGDAGHYGLSDSHIASLCDEIHLYLLLAGLKIAYGGALMGDFSKGSNFTLRLFELVRGYSKLADGVNAPPLKDAILNVAPWPLRLNYGDSEFALFGRQVASYQEGPRPDVPWSDDELFPPLDGKRTLASDTPLRRYAWALGLTAMRKQVTTNSQARLVLGGKMTGFAGLVPGVVEESWISLAQRKPLFLVGGFGGAARAICDLLRGTKREEFTTDWARQHIDDYDTAVGYYSKGGQEFISLKTMGLSIANNAGQDLGRVLNNGLDDRENRELMASTDVQRISGLVLTGLGRL